MNEDFKKWLCELNAISMPSLKVDEFWRIYLIEILIKAFWEINDRPLDFNMRLHMDECSIVVWNDVPLTANDSIFSFNKKETKIETLIRSLQHVYDNQNK